MSTIIHAQGFARKGEVRGVHVMLHEANTVIEIARGVIERCIVRDETELLYFRRTWSLDAYGVESAVTEVEAVTRTTLDHGETWTKMWHWFGTGSTPWPLADLNPEGLGS